jgi:uncharacterized surface protein with fasciclin (FAS1) repeats
LPDLDHLMNEGRTMIGARDVLTGLLTMGLAVASAACTESNPVEAEPGNIVQVASQAGTFNTLVAAVQAAELVEVLQSEGPFTVFAPTDAAFAALPAGTVESLLANPEQLRAVLTYHVVAGRVTAGELVNSGGGTPATVNGQRLNVVVTGGTVRVDGATVVTADVMASNGVIHVIDRVLIPGER